MTTLPEEAVREAYSAYVTFVEGSESGSVPVIDALRAALIAALPHLPQGVPSATPVQVSGNSGQLNSATDMGNPITLTYTNYRGETSERTITPIRSWYGSTEWHPEPQWLLTAFDHEKQANRDFAIKDFGWRQPKVEKGDTFKGTVDGDTELQAAARHAGWALIELVDEIDWLKREQVSDIITRLGIALNEPSDGVGNTEGISEPSTARSLALEEAYTRLSKLASSAATGIDIVGEILMVYDAARGHPQWQRVVIRKLAEDIKILLRALSSPDHADAGKVEGDEPIACVGEMQTSSGADYYVCVKVGGREITPHMFKERWKAEYEVAEWLWLFNGGEKPDLLAYGPLPSAPSQEVAGS